MIQSNNFNPAALTYLTKIRLTPEQEIAASIFTYDQLARFQNWRADLAAEICNLTVDLTNPGEFAIQHAYKKAMLDILTTLIDGSQDAAASLVVKNETETQPTGELK